MAGCRMHYSMLEELLKPIILSGNPKDKSLSAGEMKNGYDGLFDLHRIE
jgi:hypothetical protein